ncbi:MAG: hypothetical protein NXI23_07675 [Bacteroidetes bacterium]|jgi:hypothetical protein|nr:hypothetical protein [Bacteroidota bacterium]MDF1863302.1 hypothetical protein [Saprospiraceae bacterium]
MKSINLLLLFVLIFAACNSPSKLIEKGNYDQAINLAVEKLRGKKKKKAEFVGALEKAFDRATKRDMREADNLKRDGREENWIAINRIHQKIRKRQSKIDPLIPLYDENGRKAEFRFVRIEELERESKERTAEYYYNRAQDLLKQAENGDKLAAREALNALEKINTYYKNYRDTRQLEKIAFELGTTHILFKMDNNSGSILPRGFESRIKKMSVRDLNSKWKNYYLNSKSNLTYDFTVVMNLTTIDVSQESEKERQYVDDKEIEDGFEYVLDERGNVKKDTAGNDIKVPKKVFIKANVFEIYQHKAAAVGGQLDFFDNQTRELIHSEPMTVEAVFENYASRFEGDERALSEDSKKRIGNKPRPFPTNNQLLLDAADKLKPIIKREMSRQRLIR